MRSLIGVLLGTTLILAGVNRAGGQNPSGTGLRAEIIAASIPADRHAVVTFKISDAKGDPLALEDLERDSVRFTVAALAVEKSGERGYQNYIVNRVTGQEYAYGNERKKPVLAESLQPGADEGGTLSRSRPGVFIYKFRTALPSAFDRRATHVIGGEMTRENHKFAANPLYEFIPAGGKVSQRFDVADTTSCNQCHDPMSAHARTARETGYCALCHTSQLTDPETGESLDFKYFIHKLHRGKYLPSVKSGRPYYVVGAGRRIRDFSTIVSPRGVVTETIPKEYRDCAACHRNPDVTAWKTRSEEHTSE